MEYKSIVIYFIYVGLLIGRGPFHDGIMIKCGMNDVWAYCYLFIEKRERERVHEPGGMCSLPLAVEKHRIIGENNLTVSFRSVSGFVYINI